MGLERGCRKRYSGGLIVDLSVRRLRGAVAVQGTAEGQDPSGGIVVVGLGAAVL